MSKKYQLDIINEDEVFICFGFGCINIGFLTENFYGCSMKNEFCCLMHEFCCLNRPYLTCCDKLEGHHIRIGCFMDAITFKIPEVIIKNQIHCMCMVCSCSLPPDEEVPCIAACCSIVCGKCEFKPLCKNCVKFGDIRD